MTGEIRRTPTNVPIKGGRDVTIEAGKPWPSTYRGSKYSLVDSRDQNRDHVVRWQHKELPAYCTPPTGLLDAMQAIGKSDSTGKGSFRITADGEVLTKVNAASYVHSDQAPHSDGWIAVYVGRLHGKLGFDKINIDPSPPTAEIKMWDGFTFNHGERWAVGLNDKLIWKRPGYRFESAFDHPELIGRYQKYRRTPGRLYINEYGHIWINVPRSEVPAEQEQNIESMVDQWYEQVEHQDDTTAKRLVTRRLKMTSPDDEPETGHLPVYVGNLRQFDDGVIPRPIVTDESYFVDASRDPTDRFN